MIFKILKYCHCLYIFNFFNVSASQFAEPCTPLRYAFYVFRSIDLSSEKSAANAIKKRTNEGGNARRVQLETRAVAEAVTSYIE